MPLLIVSLRARLNPHPRRPKKRKHVQFLPSQLHQLGNGVFHTKSKSLTCGLHPAVDFGGQNILILITEVL